MPVVINEFEVIPEPAPTREPSRPEQASPAGKPRDADRELRRMLDERRARALRLMAV
jgi:hypothetical protein